ncbi:hypothetical protein QP185_19980 [Sphingomonas aerolata]|uniref:hypothetical protein n=1 Tax=Sphingomonas aerolata TaxID=185951 RepID=UPI002FE021AC
MQPWLPVDTVSINGRKGTRYFISGVSHNPGAMPLVISRDPSLAMLAAGHRRLAAMQESNFPGDDGQERVSFREVIAQGAPIDLLGSQLVSISTAAIPSTRFRVPAACGRRSRARASSGRARSDEPCGRNSGEYAARTGPLHQASGLGL